METKMCSKCKEVKTVSEFSKNSRHKSGCKSHCKECHNAGSRKYKAENKDKVKKYNKEYGSRDYVKKTKLEKTKIYNKKNREKVLAKSLQYHKNHPEVQRRWRDRNKEELFARDTLRRLFNNWGGKRSEIESMLCYTFQDLKSHLKQFGEYTKDHHIDHIIPISYLASVIKDPIILARFSNDLRNLMLLTKKDNISKRNNLTTEFIPDFHLPVFIDYCLELEEYIENSSVEFNCLAA